MSGIYNEIKGVWLHTPKYVYIAGLSNYDAFVIRVSGWCSSYLVDFTYYVNLRTSSITRINNGVNTQVVLYIKNDATGICIATSANSNLFVGVSAKNSLRVSDVLESGYTLKTF